LPTSVQDVLRRRLRAGERSGHPARRACLILTYHRVAVSAEDPLELCVAPERFREQLQVLRSLGDIVPLGELARLRGRRGVRFAITFDDGYADNALAAAPILDGEGAAATVFVVAGAVGSRRPFWWDRLSQLLFAATAPPSLELDGERFALGGRTAAERMNVYLAVWSRLRLLTPALVEQALEQVEQAVGPVDGANGARPVDEAELMALAQTLEIGGHTVSHPSLPTLASGRQRDELEVGRSLLERLIDRPVRAFAYPFGDYDADTRRAVKDAGFRYACTVHEGPVSVFSSRFLLPRVTVRDWPGERLEAELHRWLRA
jgi:peptidoglycan/xylan/chitin deacetylase (PgdA/CDA1 family)